MSLKYFCEFLPRVRSLNLTLEISPDLQVDSFQVVSPQTLAVKLNSLDQRLITLPYPLDNVSLKLDFRESLDSKGYRVIELKIAAQDNRQLDSGLLVDHASTWNKAELLQLTSKNGGLELKCVQCSQVLVHQSQLTSVHDLPSESWSEMMDFWHCHKPAGEVSDEIKMRYNDLKPGKGSLVLGSYYFLINQGDFGLDTPHCTSCGAVLGHNHNNNTMRINKWGLVLGPDHRFEPYYHAYSIIIDNINFNASRFYNLVDEESESGGVVVWVFNFGLKITSSETSGQVADNCLKVMYYEGHEDKFEDIALPSVVLKDLLRELNRTNEALCEGLQRMQQWKTGYLYVKK